MKKIGLILVSLLVSFVFFVTARPVQAAPVFELWEDVQCVTDINCTIEVASTSALNFVFRSVVGQDYDKLTDVEVSLMRNGEWNKGLAAKIGEVESLVYKAPPEGYLAKYIKDTLSSNILNSKVAAQDTAVGTVLLDPIRIFWSAARNVAYALFAIVMVAIGIMIILRQQISPRVVVTFTSALPRILMGLVLITFSLPLVALIVDIGAVFGSALVVFVTSGAGIQQIAPEISVTGASAAVAEFGQKLIAALVTASINLQTTGLVGLITLNILTLVGTILMVLTLIKLVSAYAHILIYTVFSPILILFGSLPGQEESIVKLGKQILAKTLVFPVVLFFLIMALFFAAYTVVPGAATLLSGGSIGEVVGNSIIVSFMGPILTLSMLMAGFKAPSLIEEGLGIGGGKPRKK